MRTPIVSVVVATHNRPESLRRLVGDLVLQSLSPEQFEVIVVDDGSDEEAALHLLTAPQPRSLTTLRRDRGGPGAARHTGTLLARGEILVFVDDDMRCPTGFLAAHLAQHRALAEPVVVLGNILPSDGLPEMPLFERYHARQMERYRAAATAGSTPMRGVHLCTGNVSMRRTAYHEVGGFDPTLERSEDRELGVRLERAGYAFVFGAEAVSYHGSDHTDPEVWLRRAYLYGRFDTRIARMHRDAPLAHPWRFWSLVNPLARPLIAVAIAAPRTGRVLARLAYDAGRALDAIGLERPALTLAALTYGLEYFRGMREECGSLRATRAEVAASRPHPVEEGRRRGPFPRLRALGAAIRADYDATRRQRFKYHGEEIPAGRIWIDAVRKIGFQMLIWYRVMRFFREARVPLVPQVVSRLIRHLYAAEIHPDARIEPGVSIVHGVGLVISHAAVVEAGCILFQNVTLGENLDRTTGRVGAPTLGRDVHVGPGATLLGPITVGDESKVLAGTLLMRSVPARSLVSAAAAAVRQRANPVARADGPRVRPVRLPRPDIEPREGGEPRTNRIGIDRPDPLSGAYGTNRRLEWPNVG
jgi:serine acetyltransferase/GT2 family glycosyltransferase